MSTKNKRNRCKKEIDAKINELISCIYILACILYNVNTLRTTSSFMLARVLSRLTVTSPAELSCIWHERKSVTYVITIKRFRNDITPDWHYKIIVTFYLFCGSWLQLIFYINKLRSSSSRSLHLVHMTSIKASVKFYEKNFNWKYISLTDNQSTKILVVVLGIQYLEMLTLWFNILKPKKYI